MTKWFRPITVASITIGGLFCSAALSGGVARGAEVKVLAAEIMLPALSQLAGGFEQATGHKLAIGYDSAGRVRTRVQGGELVDVVIIQKPAAAALGQQNVVRSESIITVGRSGIAAAVPKGAPRPDVSSIEALKRTLLSAKSIAYPDPGVGAAVGIVFRKEIEQLGVAQEVNAKAKLMPSNLAKFAADDTADLVIGQPMDILAVPTYELVGWLPKELQEPVNFTWAAAITTKTSQPEAAQTLLQFLASPAARAVINAKGMETGEQ
jgi:molybdate transport system substrate-binding protein